MLSIQMLWPSRWRSRVAVIGVSRVWARAPSRVAHGERWSAHAIRHRNRQGPSAAGTANLRRYRRVSTVDGVHRRGIASGIETPLAADEGMGLRPSARPTGGTVDTSARTWEEHMRHGRIARGALLVGVMAALAL